MATMSVPQAHDFLAEPRIGVLSMRAAGRATLVAEGSTPRIRQVSVECELTDELPPDPAHTRAMASRYMPADTVEAFVASVPVEGRFVLRPVRWRSADLG